MLSLYAYWALTDTLSNANEKFLNNEVRVFRNILYKHPDNANLLSQEVEWVPEELEASEYHYFARISDPKSKKVIAMTQGMPALFKTVTFPEPANVTEDPEETDIFRSKNGNAYLLIAAIAKVGHSNETRLVEIALDISPQEQIIAKYRRNLIAALILAMGCAVALGMWVARKGMRNLNHITEYAEAISISKLDLITVNNSPKELQRLISALNRMLQRIENAFNRLSLFSKELAHELRTPLNNLMGEAEIVLSRERSSLEYKEVITSSMEEYLRLSKMIENILFLAKTENPSAKLRMETLCLNKEFQDIAENFEPILQEKQIKIEIAGDEKLLAEPNLLRRALNNLISNAIRFTAIEGKIVLSCKRIMNAIQIIVEDNGIGIAKEHLPHICDRFYRVKQDTFPNSQGLGLGLSIVSSIMELHAGRIDIKSNLGQGTTIHLLFPYNA